MSWTSPSLVARCRYELARRRWLYRCLVAGLVGVAAWAVVALVSGVEAERRRWGESVAIAVALDDIAPGTPLSGRVEWRQHPVAVVPASAVRHLDPAAAARRTIVAGSVVTERDVGASSAPQALLAPDELAVAITERVPSGARVGDGVVVASDGVVLAEHATVVGVHDDRVTVAVGAATAPMVAAAAAGPSGVTLLLTP